MRRQSTKSQMINMTLYRETILIMPSCESSSFRTTSPLSPLPGASGHVQITRPKPPCDSTRSTTFDDPVRCAESESLAMLFTSGPRLVGTDQGSKTVSRVAVQRSNPP